VGKKGCGAQVAVVACCSNINIYHVNSIVFVFLAPGILLHCPAMLDLPNHAVMISPREHVLLLTVPLT